MEIEICKIQIGDSRRAIDGATVEKLADSMKQVGLLNPITIDYEYNLIAGAHRIAAAKKLGWEQIPCNMLDIEDLQAKLAELDENLVRNNGNVIEQGEWLAEKKRIYERLHPETKKGQSGGWYNNKGQNLESEENSFSRDTAEKTGLSKRTIEQSIQIAENLVPEVKEFAKEIGINKTNALDLARKTPEEQRKIVEPIQRATQALEPEKRKETAHRMLNEDVEVETADAIRRTYTSAITKPSHLEMKPENVQVFYEQIEKYGDVTMYITMIDRAVKNLQQIKEVFLHPKRGGILS